MALLAAPGLNTIGQLWFHYLQIVNKQPSPEDLRVFTVVARKSGFAAAAEVGASPAYVSKRIRLLEEELGVKLLHRTTRRVAVTEEGERVFHWAQRILDDMDQLMQEVAITRSEPRGLLRVSSSFGFGRHVIAPALPGWWSAIRGCRCGWTCSTGWWMWRARASIWMCAWATRSRPT